jgi:hypothetical protein
MTQEDLITELAEALRWALDCINCAPDEWTLAEDTSAHYAAIHVLEHADTHYGKAKQ